jgi:probable HAF family extracellular repeat protein
MSHLSPLKVPNGLNTRATAINNSGQIVGTLFDDLAHQHGFFRESNGAITILDFPAAMITFPNGINDLGQIVGSYLLPYPNNNKSRAFVYSSGRFAEIDVPEASGEAAYGINNVGQIVGALSDGTRTHGFLYAEGKVTRFDVPGAFETDGRTIKNLGQIVGRFGDASTATTLMHGFLRDTDGSLTTFDAPGTFNTFVTGSIIMDRSLYIIASRGQSVMNTNCDIAHTVCSTILHSLPKKVGVVTVRFGLIPGGNRVDLSWGRQKSL